MKLPASLIITLAIASGFASGFSGVIGGAYAQDPAKPMTSVVYILATCSGIISAYGALKLLQTDPKANEEPKP